MLWWRLQGHPFNKHEVLSWRCTIEYTNRKCVKSRHAFYTSAWINWSNAGVHAYVTTIILCYPYYAAWVIIVRPILIRLISSNNPFNFVYTKWNYLFFFYTCDHVHLLCLRLAYVAPAGASSAGNQVFMFVSEDGGARFVSCDFPWSLATQHGWTLMAQKSSAP